MAKSKRIITMYDLKRRLKDERGAKWYTVLAGITSYPTAYRTYRKLVRESQSKPFDHRLVKVLVTEQTIRTTAPLKKGKNGKKDRTRKFNPRPHP